MKITVLDTHAKYLDMLALTDEKRAGYFSENFLAPFAPLFAATGMPASPEAVCSMPLSGADDEMVKMLNRLASADVWNRARGAIAHAADHLHKAGILLPEAVTVGIFLGDPQQLAASQGYTGVGSLPGYIQLIIAPNSENLLKLTACLAHEFHHNALFHNVQWNFMNVTLTQYLAVEGLAESFAAALYGADAVGPWVTEVQGADLEKTRRIIGQNLTAAGFMEVRKFIFGDHPMLSEEERVGIPYCGGYAAGYHAVQTYLAATGKAVGEATRDFVLGEDIIIHSGYFADERG